MKNLITIILSLLTVSVTAQTLTLTELQNLCKLSNWETGANTLTRKGWEYHNSKRGDTYEYSTISYAYSKDAWYDDRAAAWFSFYTYNSHVEQITYQPTDNAYKAIKNSLAANGYKQTNSEIYDNYIETSYSSPSFIIEIQTTTQERAYYGGTSVSYLIRLTRKGGIYDYDNGEKVSYYDGTTTVKERYTLKDGKRNGKAYSYSEYGDLKGTFTYANGVLLGPFTIYHSNGKISVTGTLLNGEKNGLCTEYDYYGNKKLEQYYKNGEYDGKAIVYNDDGKVEKTLYFTNGKKHGKFNEYIYKDGGELSIQTTGNYVDDEKDGLWETKAIKDGKWYTIVYSNYDNGTLNGAAKEWEPGCDSVVYCNYKYGKLDGDYVVKRSIIFFNSSFLFDDDNLYKAVVGYYYEGKKSGLWTYYNLLMQPEAEGRYCADQKDGQWKYYYVNNNLDCIANYTLGKLNGKFIKFKQTYMNNKNIDPSCSDIKIDIKDSIDYICNFLNDRLDGHYEKHDNDGNIISEGEFFLGKRTGRWVDIDTDKDVKWVANYINSELYGICEEYFYESNKKHFTYNFNNGVLDGRQIWHNEENGSTFMESVFVDGTMQSQTIFNDNNVKTAEFNLTNKGTYIFEGTITHYPLDENSEISKISEDYIFYENPDSVLTHPFISIIWDVEKNQDGKVLTYDRKNRIIIEGQRSNGSASGNWTHRFYNQNVFYIENMNDGNKPILFYVIDTHEQYSGKFIRQEVLSDNNVTATYKIKKSLIEEIVYSNPTTGKTVQKVKFKNGLQIDK